MADAPRLTPEHDTSPSLAGRRGLPPGSSWRRAVLLACLLFGAGYGLLGLLRYWTFHSRSLDMAYYVRLVWGMARGYPDNPVVGAPHWLGLHFEPALLVPALLSRLGIPVAELLLVLQAAAAALALLPLHALARRRLFPSLGSIDGGRAEALALLAALTLYLAPTVSRCLDYDFHPSTVLLLPLCAWIDAIDAGRLRQSRYWLLGALALREDVGLQIASAALPFLLRPRGDGPPERGAQRRELGLQGLFGLLWFGVYAFGVQPHFLPDPSGGSFGAHFERFGGGAGGVAGVLRAALAHPIDLLGYLTSEDRLLYLPSLLLTVGLLPLWSPRWLCGILPVLAINLLSDFRGVRKVESHYATAMVPFLVVAAIEGAARLSARVRRAPAAPVLWLLACAAAAFWLRGAAPGAPDFSLDSYRSDDNTRRWREQVRAAGGQPRVVADYRPLAHLAERPEPLLDPSQRRYWKR